jgi:integrase
LRDRLHRGPEDGWKNVKHAAQWLATLETYAMPIIGNMLVQSVDVGMVHKVLEPIWSSKTERRPTAYGGGSKRYWIGRRFASFAEAITPRVGKGHLENLFPRRSKVQKVEHHPTLPYTQMGEFMMALKAQEGIGAFALQFTILTAARTGEVANAKWSEIDFDEGVWTVPANRMKTWREHRVPLSKPALAILWKRHELRGKGAFVFSGARRGKPICNMAMLQTLRRTERVDLTVHGFRSTFRDWAAEQTAFRARSSRLRWRMWSATKSRSLIGAAIYSRSAAS